MTGKKTRWVKKGTPKTKGWRKTGRMSLKQAVTKASKAGEVRISKWINLADETTSAQCTNAVGTYINYNQSGGTAGTVTFVPQFTASHGSMILQYGSITTPALTQLYQGWSYEFCIGNIPDLLIYAGLYDKYRIVKVKIVITPYATMAPADDTTGGGVNSATNPILHYAIDYDSAQLLPGNNEAGITLLQQYRTYQRKRLIGGKPIVIVVNHPRRNMGVEQVGGTVMPGTEVSRNAWTDCALPSVVFFGLKAMWEVITTATNQVYNCPIRVETEYTVEFKDPL